MRTAQGRRDRRGRGMRGRLVPPHVPLARSRAEQFDDLVLDAVEELEERWDRELEGVEFAVEDVPPELPAFDTDVLEDGSVPLARLITTGSDGLGRQTRPRIVLYRRPLEARAIDRSAGGPRGGDVVGERVAPLLNKPPDEIAPPVE